jgi:hypothetical protein
MVDRYRLDQAEVQLARALDESVAVFGANDIRTLRVEESIAGLRVEQSRYRDAEQGYQRVIAVLEGERMQADRLFTRALGKPRLSLPDRGTLPRGGSGAEAITRIRPTAQVAR